MLLHEKVLQFGAGILLRGLPDYFIDQANRRGIFNGKILVVKSTPGSTEDFQKQEGRFTICVRGTDRGETIVENLANHAISRVLSAHDQWPAILAAAQNPDLQVIISNTTEVGIRFEPESIFQSPPSSFPGKLTSFLYERFKRMGEESRAIVIIPTELVPDNGKRLKDIVDQLIRHNKLDERFTAWLDKKTFFCSSLVDRIVTRPSEIVSDSVPDFNSLTIQSEPYRLWAIEGGEPVKEILSFAAVDKGVIITDSIEAYLERKLRLLNGTHTVTACLGFLNGLDTVYQCMQDLELSAFVENVMLTEIEPTLPDTARKDSKQFALDVLDRFRNPYTAHRLLSITLHGTAKMKMRNVPTLIRYVDIFKVIPALLTKGFAAHLLFMKVGKKEGDRYFGVRKGTPYPIQDEQAGYFHEAWQHFRPRTGESLKKVVIEICRNAGLWDKDLTELPKFVETVTGHLQHLLGPL